MGKASRDKGKVGEREFARVLREAGFDARRGRQYQGGDDTPDVVHSIPGVHFEVKRVESLRLWDSLAQAESEAAPGKIPVVAHRPNRRDWIAIMPMADFLELLKGPKDAKEKD